MSSTPIYLDNHATTPLDPDVLEAMLPYLREDFGNASSRHHIYGQRAHQAVETAREQVAALLGAEPDEIIFTSGATESNNIAIRGTMLANRAKGNHLITVATEHKAVLEPGQQLTQEGFELTVLPVKPDGLLDLKELRASLRPTTVLVSVMHANNEIGVIQPIEEIAKICREAGAHFHTDAAQSAGKLPINLKNTPIDLLSLSGHKMYGPKGIGALYVRRRRPRVKVHALTLGGGHERGIRSGTLNSPAIVGLGAACAKANKIGAQEQIEIGRLRDELLRGLQEAIPDLQVNGSLEFRLAGNLNVRLPGVDAEALLYQLKNVAASSGSACTSLKIEPSHVLLALGLNHRQASDSIRFGLGRFTLAQEISLASKEVASCALQARHFNQLAETHRPLLSNSTVAKS